MTSSFKSAPADKSELENGSDLTPRFDANGLITAVVVDSGDNEVLMLAHMNDEALRLTIETGLAHYWSRSRNQLWKKGETSGNMQTVDEIRIDCDQDAVLLKVRVGGADATCHTGRRSCFYRKVVERDGQIQLEIGSEPLFDPASVYTDH
ncbi:phosphoribosyl-AMP cyclohydrolase [uncultured Hoeflea sp.]|uniref:phosphoribosyl-AMP cyclohydrolase n=1 Tax=uncultured Hoeflea sp. TaxID=538666 RepID=UPI0030ECFAB8|tara:strand:- start:46340 stop:46789 length:450 start_codon:yes stop_codon:yes gene_type:complete